MEIIEVDDIFSVANTYDFICILTNIGWKDNGTNVMGVGIAKQAAGICKELPIRYGKWCQEKKDKLYVDSPYSNFICFPTKELNEKSPHLSWKGDSSLKLIEKSYRQLIFFSNFVATTIYLPIPGIGNGKLDKDIVLEMMGKYDKPDNITMIEKSAVGQS